jgi:3-oxoadipate enol-lactonase
MDNFDSDAERGTRNRRAILGDAWVDKSQANATSFSADFQDFITRYAWHGIWGRPGLDERTRRIIVLSITCAMGRWEEFELHVRAAIADGTPGQLSPDDLKEVLLQSAVYAGVPAANTGLALATKILREAGVPLPKADVREVSHPGAGRAGRTAVSPSIAYAVREPRHGGAPRHTVVLSHALGCDRSMWDGLAATLAEDCRVIVYDQRGHGASDAPAGPYTVPGLADDAAALIREVANGPVVFIGLSMGGMVAQELALRHPSLVKGLVLANTTAVYDAAAREGWKARIELVRSKGMAAVAEMAMPRWFGDDFRESNASTVDRWRRRVASCHPGGYIGTCEALQGMDTLDRLPGIQAPTLVIAGEIDPGTPVAMNEAIARGIPGAEFTVLPGASHLSVLERPAAFAGRVLDFLKKVPT